MKRFHAFTLAALLASAATVAGISSGSAQMNHGEMHGEMTGASGAYMDAMKMMDDHMAKMQMTGEPGVDFALMMIPHHQSAIDMAKAYLASGENDPELAKLSNDIIAAQETEIAFLRSWLEKKGH